MIPDEKVKKHMRLVLEDYVDSFGMVNSTGLAESAADYFEDYLDSKYNIDEHYFELAYEISEEYEHGNKS